MQRLRAHRLGYVLAAIVVVAAGGALFLKHNGVVHASSSTVTCPPGVPMDKCAPKLVPSTRSGVVPSTTPAAGASSSIVNAGSLFMTATQLTELQNEYGLVNVFRDGNTWVVTGNGESVTSTATPPGMAPGGPLVAVDPCDTNAACLNPDAPHPLSNFIVAPVPDPHAPLTLLAAVAGGVYFSDPVHGQIYLDLSTLGWREDSGAKRPISVARPSKGVALP